MSYTLESFCNDCRDSLVADKAGYEKIRQSMEKLLSEETFISKYFAPDAEACVTVIYDDDEVGFQVLTHVYAKGKESPPHDHGESWAIYGQAAGYTDMTVWRLTGDGSEEGGAELEPETTFRLDPAMAGIFEPGKIHSIKFPDGARFLRVTGTDLSKISTHRFDLKEGAGASGVVR